jgi:hypothetical protein
MRRLVSSAPLTAAANRRRALRAAALLGFIVSASAVRGGTLGVVTPDQWVPHATIGVLDRVTLRVHWYESLAALRKAAIERNVSSRDLQGFSILSRKVDTGEYVCDVFVVRMGGALVDNERTVTFGHEALHCFGFSHD